MQVTDEQDDFHAAVIRLLAGFLATILTGFIAGRILPRESVEINQGSTPESTFSAVATRQSPNPPSPDPASSPLAETTEKFAMIERQLAEIPPPRVEELKGLTESIREKRMLLAQLRAQLSGSDRELLIAAASARPGAGSRMLANEQAKREAEAELYDARVALAEQRWVVNDVAGSDDTLFVREVRAELRRREENVKAIEARIRSILAGQERDMGSAELQQAQQFRSWREQRAELDLAYANTLASLEVDMQAYSDLAAENVENQKRAESLRAERKALREE